MINNRPENRVYRYNFFFDNCATRPAAIIEKLAGGKIDYNIPFKQQTFRDLINYCTRNKPWLTFGCDLALGSPTDRIATTALPERSVRYGNHYRCRRFSEGIGKFNQNIDKRTHR